jgi:1-acyl-sn-glycerol-3-phosphate acyltransferase
MSEKQEQPKPGYNRLLAPFIEAPWALANGLGRLLYGFRTEGMDNLPKDGPYIVWLTEPGLIGFVVSGYVSIKVLKPEMDKGTDVLSFFHEELFRVPYFANLENIGGKYRPLVPHSAPQLAKGMLDGYRVLRSNGVVVHNPQGDATWDGLPTAFGRITAWLALRTAAPVVPILCTIGTYEIWPRWQLLPSRKGRFKLTIDEPLRLTDKPLERVTDEDIAKAQALIQETFERVHYGPGGLAGWIGPVLRDGVEVTEPVQLRPPSTPLAAVPPSKVKPNRRGVAQLLWQCPVCRTNDALVHRRPRFRPETVSCQACGTLWDFRREPGRDFRMKVLLGPPEVVGLDMALSSWYEHMNRNFSPKPIQVKGVSLLPGEEVYLEAPDVTLSPYLPNALFEGWSEREAPKKQADWLQIAKWKSLGEGRLLVTSHRVLWQGAERQIDFLWSEMAAVSQYLSSTLALHYGAAKYRFRLGNQPVIKWLHHMGELAKDVGAREGRTVNVTDHGGKFGSTQH